MIEDDMIGWHHQLDVCEFEQDREAWHAAVHGVSKRQTRLSILVTQFNSVAQLCLTLCDPMNRSTPGLPVHHQLPESTQTHVH